MSNLNLGLAERPLLTLFSTAFTDFVRSPSLRSLQRLAIAWLFRYTGVVNEVISEMAFAAAMCIDKDQQPLGGPRIFLAAMTLSVLTSGIVGHLWVTQHQTP
jgi:hypothetical protein